MRRRIGAWCYEVLLVAALLLGLGMVLGLLIPSSQRRWLQGAVYVALGVYFIYCWHKRQTLPLKTWRIAVVDASGAPLSYSRAALRYVLAGFWWWPPLVARSVWPFTLNELGWVAAIWVMVWAASSQLAPGKQFWHDIWAGTRLVNA